MAKFKLLHRIDNSGLNSKLKHLIRNTDLTKVMDEIGADMRTQTQLNFRNSRSPDGEKWKKHADSTLKTYKSKGRISPKLLESDRNLRKSVKTYTHTKNSASMTSNLKYSKTHQYGDNQTITRKKGRGKNPNEMTRPFKRNIPARPYMGITRKMVNRYNKWIRNHIVNGKT